MAAGLEGAAHEPPDACVHVVGRTPELREDGAGRRRRSSARGAFEQVHRPHRPALRRADVRRRARRPRLPAAGPLPRRRLGHPRRADGQGARRLRARSSSRSSRARSWSPATSTRRSPARSPRRSSASRSRTSRPACARATGRMPEEINRVLTDRLSDVLLTHSPEALDNLCARGHRPRARALRRQHDDRLAAALRAARARAGRVRRASACATREYVLVTFHRPGNVDDPLRLDQIVIALDRARGALPRRVPDAPAHARAAGGQRQPGGARGRGRALHRAGRLPRLPLAAGRRGRDPHRLRRHPGGGLGARRRAASPSGPNTERPVTLTHGTNTLLGDDPMEIASVAALALGARRRARSRSGTATPPSASPTCWSRATSPGAGARRDVAGAAVVHGRARC